MLKLLDTSSIIMVLEEIKCPEIFDHCINRGHTLAITRAVFDELSVNKESFKKFKEYGNISILQDDCQQSGRTYEHLKNRYPSLHEGEISVLCHASEMSHGGVAHYCIIDDNAARKRKNELSIQLTGTIGLLLWGKATGCFSKDECKSIYQKIINSNFWISSDILKRLLDD